jgi:hypothetical protein
MREWLTREETRSLIKDELQPYHNDNLLKFDKLFEVVNQLRGVLKALGFLIGVPATIVAIIEIIKFSRGN